MSEKIKLGISMGDPNGVGIEIILKIFEDKRMFDFFSPIIFAPIELLERQKQFFNLTTNLFLVKDTKKYYDGNLNVYNIEMLDEELVFGRYSKAAGSLAFKSIKEASIALKDGEVDALVTSPINKKTIQSEDFSFPGHTSYFADFLNGEGLMFMISDELKVALVTDHIPVKEISDQITSELLKKKIHQLEYSLKFDFDINRPRIAVLGLNPHSGDMGVIGYEEDKMYVPVIKELSEKGLLVFGPYAADSFFGNQRHLNFDAILASYHDQGLIPFKSLTFGEGTNFTAGLSKVRTSPDHGTAFEIAGKGIAKVSSFRSAMYMARRIFLNRKKNQNFLKFD
jgi:4-hydroxythreonine-4-phosphate dehydrogenase